MNGGLFHKITYKCELMYQQKKKEYQTAIDRYKHEITNLRRLKTIYTDQIKYIQKQKNVGNKNGPKISVMHGSLIHKNISRGKLQFFGTEERECSPQYIENLIQLENRFTALKSEYNNLYDEVVGLKSQLDKLDSGNNQQRQFNQPRNNFNNAPRQFQDNMYNVNNRQIEQ